jgi:hypothetical protein
VTKPGMEMPSTPEEAHAWERRCLAELEQRVASLRDERFQPKISDVHLDGSYPDTRICVRFWQRSRREEQTKCFELWGSSFKAPRGLETPDQVALLVHTWILESH